MEGVCSGGGHVFLLLRRVPPALVDGQPAPQPWQPRGEDEEG